MLLLLPFALLLGVAGDKGIQATLLFVQNLLGAFAVKIIYGFYLSFVLMFTVALSKIPVMRVNVGLLATITSIILVFAIKYRKRFYELIMSVIALDPGARVTSKKPEI